MGRKSNCLSHELTAWKGSYVVLAGVFNYQNYDEMSELASALSAEFDCPVMHMCWDEECDTVNCQVWRRGAPLEGTALSNER